MNFFTVNSKMLKKWEKPGLQLYIMLSGKLILAKNHKGFINEVI